MHPIAQRITFRYSVATPLGSRYMHANCIENFIARVDPFFPNDCQTCISDFDLEICAHGITVGAIRSRFWL